MRTDGGGRSGPELPFKDFIGILETAFRQPEQISASSGIGGSFRVDDREI
ncbi:MAG: hypothetical protein ACRYG8_40540 [Janthinobacterium lividum]